MRVAKIGCTSVHTWQRVCVTAQRRGSGKLLEIVVESRTVLFATFRATCFAMALRDKLLETFHNVTVTYFCQALGITRDGGLICRGQ